VKSCVPTTEYARYTADWDRIASTGLEAWNLDVWAGGRRYLSLVALSLTASEAAQLREVTTRFGPLLDRAVDGILSDSDWWSGLAWPWAAIELAHQEPAHPGNVSLFGRFDFLLNSAGNWQVVEYNADTPSGGREATGLEPAVAALHPSLLRITDGLAEVLTATLLERVRQHNHRVVRVGIVSAHSWLEDLAQATWLARRLRAVGQDALVGDVTDLANDHGRILLRGAPIDALYRFYPIERLYRHAIFGPLCEAALDGRLLLLNGLRGFLAQSKACLAWLWANRATLPGADQLAIERHLPRTVLARDPAAVDLLPEAVVKHVNGREGDSVVFGRTLDEAGWEARLLEGGYVVQQAVDSPPLEDVEVDDVRREVRRVGNRFACVGGFLIGGRFAGCYTRLDGPVTSGRATYAATLREST
jgi:glutathionylspermidine synthase